ncbi:MAG: hypothetical protein ACPGGK_04575 [Pikeienuella sp.]
MSELAAPRGLTERLLLGWRAPVRAIEAEVASAPGEPRLLAYAVGAAFFLTLGPVLSEAIRPLENLGEDRMAWFSMRFVFGMSFLPLSLYLVASVVRITAAGFGGEGDWRVGRLALFWSALISSPLAVLAHVVGAVAGYSDLAAIVAGLIWAFWLTPAIAVCFSLNLRHVAIFMIVIAIVSQFARMWV